MTRHITAATEAKARIPISPVPAPALDLSSIGTPQALSAALKADGSLPDADVVLITWTDMEWNALDHVFVHGDEPRQADATSWKNAWRTYNKGADPFQTDGYGGPLWGDFQMVQVNGHRVLLLKSNAHLAHEPWIKGLRAMIQSILDDTQAKSILSLGTAGGARLEQKLGDVVVTNAAYLQATLPDNKGDAANGKTFTSAWFPPLALVQQAQKLLFPLAQAASSADLATLFAMEPDLQSSGIQAADLINAPLCNLSSPTVRPMQGIPLNSSDDYGIAPGDGDDPYSVYEEDDAVIAQVATERQVQYASVRNVSDPVVPDKAGPVTLSLSQRKAWSGAIYSRYQFLTAVNGAIAGLAMVAAM
jgi:hypothetical protein